MKLPALVNEKDPDFLSWWRKTQRSWVRSCSFPCKKPEDPQQKQVAQKSLNGLLKSFTGWVFHIARYRQPPIYTNMNHRNHPTGRWFLKFLDPTGSTGLVFLPINVYYKRLEHQPFMDRWIYHAYGTYRVKASAFSSQEWKHCGYQKTTRCSKIWRSGIHCI